MMESLLLNESIITLMPFSIFFDSFERLKKPALRSLAVAHGILMLDRKISSGDLRESAPCHVGLGQCSSSNYSYQGCDSVRKALGIQFGDGLEDSIALGSRTIPVSTA